MAKAGAFHKVLDLIKFILASSFSALIHVL